MTEKQEDRIYKIYLEEREYFKKRIRKLTKKFYDDLQKTILFYEEELKKEKK